MKCSFGVKEDATSAGAKIKKAYPIVVVTVVDTKDGDFFWFRHYFGFSGGRDGSLEMLLASGFIRRKTVKTLSRSR